MADECVQSIKELFQKYETDEYMLKRIHSHVVNYLPKTLDNEYNNYKVVSNCFVVLINTILICFVFLFLFFIIF
jgi:hypothetical protein